MSPLTTPPARGGAREPGRAGVLGDAALRVAGAWTEWAPEAGAPAAVVEELAVLVAAQAAGGPLAPAPYGVAALRRRLLPALRAEVLRIWTEMEPAPPGEEMVGLLRAFEAASQAPAAEHEPVHALPPAIAEGFDLIVEVAHDIRSPLTSILFLAETLRRGQSGEVNALQHRQLGLIYSAALGMVSLTSDVIELAHGGERLVEARGSPFSVSEMISSVCDLVHPIAEEKGIALHAHPLASDRRIGFSAALSRVLVNLVANALRYTDEGRVEIAARPAGPSRVEFSVRDTGPGIGAEHQSTLFDPFRPGRRSDRYGFSGTGLGLTICRRLVHAMGSELRLESSPEAGTCFHFEVDLPHAPM